MSDNNEKKVNLRRKQGSYSISVVADMFGVHQQTIRLYEKEGLITPSRSSGNTRKFTEEDVAQLEEVIYLTHKLGVNLAGVAVVMKLKKKIKKMQDEINNMFEKTKSNLDKDSEILKHQSKQQLSQLAQIKAKKSSKSDESFGPSDSSPGLLEFLEAEISNMDDQDFDDSE